MKTTSAKTQPFVIGQAYKTKAGESVKIIEEIKTPGHEHVKGDDGICRYQREVDRGRVTGTNDADQRDLVPLEVTGAKPAVA